MLVELAQMFGEDLEAIAEHARQFARRFRRIAGQGAHLVDLRLQIAQALFGLGVFGNEGGQGALALAEIFGRVSCRQLAPGVKIE